MRLAAAALAAMLVIACGGSNNATSLPRLAVTFARTPVPIALGSYCWQTEGQGRCVDGGSIQSEIRTRGLDPVRVLPGSPGQIALDRSPLALNLTDGFDEQHLEPVPLSGRSFHAPSVPGRYAFRLSGHWREGDASWVFVVTVAAA